MRAVLMALSLMLIAGVAHADKIYRWTGSDGKVYYGDLPPSGARDIRGFDRRAGTSASATPAETETPDQQAAREVECASKRSQLNTYKNATRLVEKDSLGREREFTAAEREQIVARTQADLESQCGDAPAE